MFAFSLDEERRHLDLRLSGFWNAEEMDRFEQEMPLQLKALRALGHPNTCLIDALDFPVQSQPILARHSELLKSLASIRVDRIATLASSAMVRLQAGRVTDYLDLRVFSDRTEALTWLGAAD